MSNSMSNSMSNPGSSMSNVVINGNLDIDDVLTVVTSRAERSFNVSLAEAKSRIANLTRDIKNKTDEISKRRKQECLDLVAAKVDGLRAGVEAIGGKVDVSDCCKNGAGGDLKLGATITIKHASIGGYGRFASFDFEGEPSKVLLAMEAELVDLTDKQNQATQDAMHWKKKIMAIPSLERQYKAKIAEAKLATSTDGQTLLDMLTEDLDKNMLALPAN